MYNASLLNSAPCYAPRLSSSPRFATQGFVMYNAALRPSAPRYSPRLSSTPRFSTQRFVMYNATNAATWLTAPQRLATRLRVLRRASIQLNDLFVNLSPLRPAYRLTVALLYATQRFVCYNASPRGSAFRSAPRLPAAHRNATLRFVCQFTASTLRTDPHRGAPLRCSTRRFSTICLFLFAPQLAATWLAASRLPATLLNDLFITSRLHATSLNPTPRGAFQLNDLFVNLLLQRAVLHCSATLRAASQRAAYQRNELKLN